MAETPHAPDSIPGEGTGRPTAGTRERHGSLQPLGSGRLARRGHWEEPGVELWRGEDPSAPRVSRSRGRGEEVRGHHWCSPCLRAALLPPASPSPGLCGAWSSLCFFASRFVVPVPRDSRLAPACPMRGPGCRGLPVWLGAALLAW